MHRIDHAGRRAGARQRKADADDIRDAGAFAAEIGRHHDAEQALRLGGGERSVRKPGLAIDDGRVGGRDRRNRLGAGFEAGLGSDDAQRRRLDGVDRLTAARLAVATS